MAIQIKGNLATLPGPKKNEPEHALWFSVLEQAIVDARSPTIDDVRLEALVRHVSSPWVKQICDWIDFDHVYFVECFEKIVDKARVERQEYREKLAHRMSRKFIEKRLRKENAKAARMRSKKRRGR